MAGESLYVYVKAIDGASGTFEKIGRNADSAAGAGGRLGRAFAIGGAVAVAGVVGLTAGLYSCVKSAMEAESATAKMESILKTSGATSWTTSEKMQGLASSIQKYSKFSDEAVQGSEAMMLTFLQVQNRGEGVNAIFDRAIHATADMAGLFEGDMSQAALALGKALNDPIAGVTALRRKGIQLTDQQQDLIKSFMAVGDIAGAQKVILEEVEKQMGQVAEAGGQTLAGKLERAKNAFDEFKEKIGNAIIPALASVAEWLARVDWAGFATKVTNAMKDAYAGIKEFQSQATTAIDEFFNAASRKEAENALKAEQNQGLTNFIEAIKRDSPTYQAECRQVAATFTNEIKKGTPETIKAAEQKMDGMLKALISKSPQLKGQQANLMSALKRIIQREDFRGATVAQIDSMAQGIAAESEVPVEQVRYLLNLMHGAVTSDNFGPDGQAKTNEFASGIGAAIGNVSSVAGMVANAAASAMNNGDYYGAGSRAGNSFASGLRASALSAISQVAAAAAAAVAGIPGGDGGRVIVGDVSRVGGGNVTNVVVNAGAFMGTPAEARRFAKFLQQYLVAEGAR